MINSEAETYKSVSTITGQTAADTLMDYIYYTNLLAKQNSTILVGVKNAMLNVNPSA